MRTPTVCQRAYDTAPLDAKEPAPKGELSLDLSGYPEDTFLSGSDCFNVDGFWSFSTFANLELDFLTINQGFAATADDVGEVNEEVFVAVAANKPKALLIVEELYGAFWHIGVLTFVGLGSLATKIKMRLTPPELTRHLQLKVSGSKLFQSACEYL